MRGHFVGQLPFWRLAPFLVIGGGGMGVERNGAVGRDIDAVFHWGPGLKFFANRWIALRLDLRHLVGARVGYRDGAASHFESCSASPSRSARNRGTAIRTATT